jgi:hypothetical protein
MQVKFEKDHLHFKKDDTHTLDHSMANYLYRVGVVSYITGKKESNPVSGKVEVKPKKEKKDATK